MLAHTEARFPGALNRTEAMKEPEFQMTASHLARTLAGVRKRERLKIAKYLDDQADVADSADIVLSTPAALREAAEYVRSIQDDAPVPAAAAAPDPVETLYRDGPTVPPPSPSAVIEDDGSGLPPVRHMDDFAEGIGMVRNLGARGRLNLPTD